PRENWFEVFRRFCSARSFREHARVRNIRDFPGCGPMKQGRLLAWRGLGVLVSAALIAGFVSWRRAVQTKEAWTQAVPTVPDLAQWPEPFRSRVAGEEAKLSVRSASGVA